VLHRLIESAPPSSGISKDGSYGTEVTDRPPSLPVDLWIIGVQQLIRLQIGYTFPRKCGSGRRRPAAIRRQYVVIIVAP
jgi:hypothetical protein